MADITREVGAIRAAVDGEEVRGSIANAIEAMNENAEAAEQWATGGTGGTASETNNAKAYAEQAAASAATFETDPTLKISGKAADAKATGDAIAEAVDSIIDGTVLYDAGFSVTKYIGKSDLNNQSVAIAENIAVTGGDTLVVTQNVSASISPSIFTRLQIMLIEYDSGGSVLKRTTSFTSPLTLNASTVKINLYVSYDDTNASGTAYTETFTGHIRITVGNVYLKADIKLQAIDAAPTSGSDNPVESGGVYTALQGKQGTLTFDNVPTASSSNPAKSGGIYTAIQDASSKQQKLTTESNAHGIQQIVDRKEILNDAFCDTERIYASGASGTIGPVLWEDIDVTAGESITVLNADIRAETAPTTFTDLCLRAIEYNSSNTVVKRTTLQAGTSFTVNANTTKMNITIYAAFGTVTPAYYETFTGFCSIIRTAKGMKLRPDIRMPEKLEPNDSYYYNGLYRKCYNPYKAGGSLELAGQMHCHVRLSENEWYGNGDIDTALAAYVSAGYDFVTITDYSYIPPILNPAAADIPEGLIYLWRSCEVSFSGSDDDTTAPARHMCCYNTVDLPDYRNAWISAQEFADISKPQGKIVTLAHPFYAGTPQSPYAVGQIKDRIRFCEVYNGLIRFHYDNGDTGWFWLPDGYTTTDYAWQIMLDNGCITWGLAVSDAHVATYDSDQRRMLLKKGCIKVYCDTKDRNSIIKSLCTGNFYAVSNISVSLDSVSCVNGLYSVDLGSASGTIKFIGESGTVLSTQNGSTGAYQMTGEERFVRCRIELTSGEEIWTQPVFNLYEPDYDDVCADCEA